jgi:hypothetical protein
MSSSKNFQYLGNKTTQIVLEENIFRFKSRHFTTKGETLYFQCSKAENGCKAKIKKIMEEGVEKVDYLPNRAVHNHLNESNRIGMAQLKKSLCRRAADKTEITKGLRDIFNQETENNM